MDNADRKLKPTTVIEIALRAEQTILRYEYDERQSALQAAKRTVEALTYKRAEFREIVSADLPSIPASEIEERAITQAWNTLNALTKAQEQAEMRVTVCQIEADAAAKSLARGETQLQGFLESLPLRV